MNFQEAEKKYKELQAQHAAGKLSDADFEAEVSKLRLQDAQGRWWQIGVQSGEWYVYDGQKWSKARPPAPAAAPPPAPPPLPEEKPAPAAQKPARASALPARLFSAKPAGREGGGLPLPALIGIIAVVALIGIGVLIAAYLFLSGQFPGMTTTRPTATATRIAGLPTVIPTLAPSPTARPTDTPLPPPTVVVTMTNTPVPPTAGPPRPTATRRPAGSPTPTATKAPAVPPGVYVSKIQLDPPKPTFGQTITFHVTFYNNTGGAFDRPWLIKLYRCESSCSEDELRRSFGETPKSTKLILPGTTELTIGPWSTQTGACNYIARPHYMDASENPIPFLGMDGKDVYYRFSLCQ